MYVHYSSTKLEKKKEMSFFLHLSFPVCICVRLDCLHIRLTLEETQRLGVLYPSAVENLHITFDSPQTELRAYC